MTSPSTIGARLPQGVADYFWRDAYARRKLETELLELFRSWGYSDVIPPMFEYADTIDVRSAPEQRERLYRFLDHDGSSLALRLDMTIGVARLVGTRLYDIPMPQRFCYAGSVFRYVEPQAGRQREFMQAGVELLGADSPATDAEILALTCKSLQASGVETFRLVLGQVHYFRGLLNELDLTPSQETALQNALLRKSQPDLIKFLRDVPLEPKERRSVEGLSELEGDSLAVVDRADQLCLNDDMRAALDNLRSIFHVLDAYGVADRIQLDLSEVRNIGYYTGITFQAFAPGSGYSLGSGGRYDTLVESFGPPKPAVGVGLGLERILLARDAQIGGSSQNRLCAPQFLVATSNNADCHQLIESWRNQGVRVAVDVSGKEQSQLWQRALENDIPCALSWEDDGFHVYDNPDKVDQPSRFVAKADSWQIIKKVVDAVSA